MELTTRCARGFLGALTFGAMLVPVAAAADEPGLDETTPTTEPCPPPLGACEPCFPSDDNDCTPDPCPEPLGSCEPCFSTDIDDCQPDDPDPGDPGDDPDPGDPGDNPGDHPDHHPDHVDEPHDPSVPADPTFTG